MWSLYHEKPCDSLTKCRGSFTIDNNYFVSIFLFFHFFLIFTHDQRFSSYYKGARCRNENSPMVPAGQAGQRPRLQRDRKDAGWEGWLNLLTRGFGLCRRFQSTTGEEYCTISSINWLANQCLCSCEESLSSVLEMSFASISFASINIIDQYLFL